jgi:hypothetical protein
MTKIGFCMQEKLLEPAHGILDDFRIEVLLLQLYMYNIISDIQNDVLNKLK